MATPGGGSRRRPQTRWREPGWCGRAYTPSGVRCQGQSPTFGVRSATVRRMFAPASGQQGRRTDVLQHALRALRGLGVAHPPTVEDESQTEVAPGVAWQVAAQIGLDLDWVVLDGQPQPPAESPDVG